MDIIHAQRNVKPAGKQSGISSDIQTKAMEQRIRAGLQAYFKSQGKVTPDMVRSDAKFIEFYKLCNRLKTRMQRGEFASLSPDALQNKLFDLLKGPMKEAGLIT